MLDNYCVVCANKVSNKDTYQDLGHFNDVICNGCKDTDEAKESIG